MSMVGRATDALDLRPKMLQAYARRLSSQRALADLCGVSLAWVEQLVKPCWRRAFSPSHGLLQVLPKSMRRRTMCYLQQHKARNSCLGHHSIKVTVGTYGHFIPGEGMRFVDQLDSITPASPHT